MLAAGKLNERVAFQRTIDADDGGGGYSGWADDFVVSAQITFLRGSEPVIGQRLQGIQPAVVTVRESAATREVSTDWRIRDLRRGTIYDIKAATPDRSERKIDFLCEAPA